MDMNKKIRVALTGFMGVGKSSVARHLSNLLNCKRLDLDHFIEGHEGRRIAEIIDAEGEAEYRKIETKWLKEALDGSDARIFARRRHVDRGCEPRNVETARFYRSVARGLIRSLLAEHHHVA